MNIFIVLPATSGLLAQVSVSYFTGLTYGGAAVAVSAVSSASRLYFQFACDLTLIRPIVAVTQLEAASLQTTISINNKIVTKAATNLQLALNALVNNGAPPTLSATGTYSWTDVDIAADNSGLMHLSNAQCTQFMSLISSQSWLKSQLAAEMAKTLPVPLSGIVFGTGNITCKAYRVFGTASDQRAAFTVNGLTVTAYYALFAQDATYVVYGSSGVDHSVQKVEAAGPFLSKDNVRTALEKSLRLTYVTQLQSYIGLSCACPFCSLHSCAFLSS